jgi:hypothetical protein
MLRRQAIATEVAPKQKHYTFGDNALLSATNLSVAVDKDKE